MSNWAPSDNKWCTGKGWWDASAMGPPGATAEDMHCWGWRWVMEAQPPTPVEDVVPESWLRKAVKALT